MPRLIVQADDLAISHGTTLGIIDAITGGLVRATGIFTNCPDASFAAERVRDLDAVDVGIDLNFVTGRPVLDAARVPGLVDSSGVFRTSGAIRSAHRPVGGDFPVTEFELEPFDRDETLAEARAQVDKFFDLMGRAPAYVHHHSLVSPVSDEVVRAVASDLGVPFVDDLYRSGEVSLLPNDWYTAPFPLGAQAEADAEGAIERLLPMIVAQDVSLLVTHPGYVDAELLDVSSYSVIRARDLQLVTSARVRALLEEAGVTITSFSREGIA